ncbi:MAG: hypothetical protein D4R57_01550 [Verrucomicrobiales bacterium]|nr:MAG: hypothetical protein D4R57_01550 [Verrucomicrobiales bacterium]
MITPNVTSANFSVNVSAEDLVTLKTALASSGVLALPEGKTLDNVPMFSLRQIVRAGHPTTAVISGQLQ